MAKSKSEQTDDAPAAASVDLNARAQSLLDRVGPKPETREARVGVIAELMAGNEWVTGLTGRVLANVWNMPEATVRGDAAEASRLFAIPEEERDAMRARWYSKVENAQAQALAKGRLEAHATLLKLEGDHLGAFAPQKVEVSGTLGDLLTLGLESGSKGPAEPMGE
jgi:hypothetical protein